AKDPSPRGGRIRIDRPNLREHERVERVLLVGPAPRLPTARVEERFPERAPARAVHAHRATPGQPRFVLAPIRDALDVEPQRPQAFVHRWSFPSPRSHASGPVGTRPTAMPKSMLSTIASPTSIAWSFRNAGDALR